MNIDDVVKEIMNDNMFSKYISKHTWMSGSSTVVYPVTVWEVSKQIEFQLNTNRNMFSKFIERTCEKYPLLEMGVFIKSDGSCPSTIKFYYK